MKKYVMRLDDASEKRNVELWDKMETLLDKYGVKPLVGVIPKCEDVKMSKYESDLRFWERVHTWQKKGWTIAMHGYDHVYTTSCEGINPINDRSEFAGVELEEQKRKIRMGLQILQDKGVYPKAFFAPAHTFDENTLLALKSESDIRIISDTVAGKPYCKDGFTFVPQQCGAVRKLPFALITFCYHPNTMKDVDFSRLEEFLRKYAKRFVAFPTQTIKRRKSFLDSLFSYLYIKKRSK